MKKSLRIALITAVIAAAMCVPAYADWYQNEAGTWYYRDDKTGQNLTDFQYIDGKWYFFSTREDESKGAMLTGVQCIVGNYFYLDPNDGGAVAFNVDYDGKHFGRAGYWCNEIGNPIFYVGWSMDSRMEHDQYLLTKIPKVNPCTEPAVTDNAECLRVVRENLDKSLWGKAFAVWDMKIPEGKRIANSTLRELYDDMGLTPWGSHTDANVVSKLAGRDIPYPNEWGPNCQMAYDWLIDFYKSYDWYNASDYEKAYHLYCYLAERFQYGHLDSELGGATDFDDVSMLVKRLGSPTWVCEDFTYFYSLFGASMGLDVGTSGGAGDWLHVFNVVWIDGELYAVDPSGYAKYGNKKNYFAPFDEIFFRDLSTPPLYYEEGELFDDIPQITY